MRCGRTATSAIALCVLLAAAGLGFIDPGPAADEATDARPQLDSIREDVVQARFEKALAAIEVLLGRVDLTPEQRDEALVLRAQAHVAFGDLDAAEADYRAILQARPGFRPDPSFTPDKAMRRFETARAATVGMLVLTLDPPDAVLTVDGRPVAPDPAGRLPLLAGRRDLRAERDGHDPAEATVDIAAGAEATLELALMPNSRSVVVRTRPDGVEVILDGRPVGRTARVPGSVAAAGDVAELVIPDIPLGPHLFELRRECFRTEILRDDLAVDLLDRTPKRYKIVEMAAVHAAIEPRGGPAGAELTLDGKAVGVLPIDRIETCPGDRKLRVARHGRTLWSSSLRLADGETVPLEVAARPNLALAGITEWPTEFAGFASAFNLAAAVELPAGDPVDASSWRDVRLGADVDLVLAVAPTGRLGTLDGWILYSPILRQAAAIDGMPVDPRPDWSTVTWGFTALDSRVGGAARVVHVASGGPAATAGLRVGDRIVAVGGRAVDTSSLVTATLAAARPELPIAVDVLRDAQTHTVELGGVRGPALPPPSGDTASAVIRAAWAVSDAAASPERADSASANLALLFEEYGQFESADAAWRRVAWGPRRGIGDGTRDYHRARVLERLGREADAIAAYRAAAASEATTFDDDGPQVAPAAADRLADFGVTVDGR